MSKMLKDLMQNHVTAIIIKATTAKFDTINVDSIDADSITSPILNADTISPIAPNRTLNLAPNQEAAVASSTNSVISQANAGNQHVIVGSNAGCLITKVVGGNACGIYNCSNCQDLSTGTNNTIIGNSGITTMSGATQQSTALACNGNCSMVDCNQCAIVASNASTMPSSTTRSVIAGGSVNSISGCSGSIIAGCNVCSIAATSSAENQAIIACNGGIINGNSNRSAIIGCTACTITDSDASVIIASQNTSTSTSSGSSTCIIGSSGGDITGAFSNCIILGGNNTTQISASNCLAVGRGAVCANAGAVVIKDQFASTISSSINDEATLSFINGTRIDSDATHGLIFLTSGATNTNAAFLNNYQSTALIATATGPFAAQAVTINIRKIGNQVTIDIPQISAATNGIVAAITISPDLPTWARPLSTKHFVIKVTDNVTIQVGLMLVGSGGTITMASTIAGAGFTALGIPTVFSTAVSYFTTAV